MNLVVLVVFVAFLHRINGYVPESHHNSLYENLHSASPEILRNPMFQGNRTSKFLFTLIRFGNEPCPTTNEEHGICYTRNQCALLRGTPAGSCAQGLGVCCQFQATCGSIVTQNGTFFRNPDFPNKYRPSSGSDVCQVRVRKQHNICQLRLNFIRFEIDGPVAPTTAAGNTGTTINEVGSCKSDLMSVTSSGATVPSICGSNSGQHVYLDFGSSDTVTLNIMLSSNANRDREWSIEILQIGCRSELRACAGINSREQQYAITRSSEFKNLEPHQSGYNSLALEYQTGHKNLNFVVHNNAPSGCLQYFEGVSGQVRSFNQGGGIHLSNMDYSVCVRMEDGMRSIEWSACTVGDVKVSGPTPLPAQTNAVVTCPAGNLNDYLVIMGGIAHPVPSTITTVTSTTDRFCDQHFGYSNSLVRSTSRPFILRFRTDGTELTTAANEASAGFCLKWQQSPQL